MELQDLESGLRAVASAGHVLGCQELTGLQAGLSVLRAREKCREILFWGKILGQGADYYVAYCMGSSQSEFPSKSFFYSGEDFEFRALPRLTEGVASLMLALVLDKPFTGSPSELLQKPAEGEQAAAGALTELDRLALVVQDIDFDTAAVPKDAFALSQSNAVVPSSAFHGLAPKEAGLLEKYVHLRPPASVSGLKAKAKNDVEFYSNFLDPLEGDLPKGCWAIRQDPAAFLVTLRSLSWPGYVAFHVPGTTKFGGAYFGYARKNRDLPFILP